MCIEDIEYDFDGQRMVGHLAIDEYRPGPRPAVLVCHEGSGLDEHVKGRAVRLAGLGYAAFALDYFGDGKPLPAGEAMTRLEPLIGDLDLTRRLGRAGLEILLAQEEVDPERVAAIGYCFGGAMVMELARDGVDLKAVAGFHPGLRAPRRGESTKVRASVLMCCGSEDPVVPIDNRVAFEIDMKESKVADWRMDVYGGVGHSFTNPRIDALGMPGFAFDAVADRRSWRSLLELLEERLRPE
ncbi:MAG TPA: dienelactone hydrolase family protein [Acidimicrobiales bacterium]|nr:dienelactone hydrolase family protein [Acidimicrobiales bacterium]